MKAKLLWVLVAINALLLVSLAGRIGGGSAGNAAYAQPRRMGDFIMIPGRIPGGNYAVVYFIDTRNGVLGAMAYDDARKRLDTMPPTNLDRIFEQGAGIGGR